MTLIPLEDISTSIVYVLIAEKYSSRKAFYVGETSRGLARIHDYLSMHFSAATDFKVGKTIQYLQESGWKIIVEYEDCPGKEERRKLEKIKIEELGKEGLLNSLASYNYKTQDKSEYEKRLYEYVQNHFAT